MPAARKPRSTANKAGSSPAKRATGRRDRVPRKWPASLVLPIPELDAPPSRRRRHAA